MEAFEEMRITLKLPFAMEIIILAAWGIWIVINNKLFNNQNATFRSWKAIYLQELTMLSHRIKKKHASAFKEWLQSLG
jgi:YbbR domain-containing protein